MRWRVWMDGENPEADGTMLPERYRASNIPIPIVVAKRFIAELEALACEFPIAHGREEARVWVEDTRYAERYLFIVQRDPRPHYFAHRAPEDYHP